MKKLLLLFLCIAFLSGCSTYNQSINADTNMKQIELGMSRDEAIRIMGKSYNRMEAFKSDNGVYVETLSFPAFAGTYMLTFEDGKLTSFMKDLSSTSDKVIIEKQTNKE